MKSLGRPTASVRRLARSLGLVLYKKPGGGLFAGELLARMKDRGPVLFAKVGIERAFYRNAERIPYPNASNIGRRKLRRDR